MPNVTSVIMNEWKKDDGTVTMVSNVTLDDGRTVPGYDLPSVPEIGKPLPDGWEVATSKAGKPYIKVAKKGGGGYGGGAAAYRNTREGQAYEQERMDRRTALMQAVAVAPLFNLDALDVAGTAQSFYNWLRATATPPGGSANGGGPVQPTPAPSPTQVPQNRKDIGEQTDGASVGTSEGTGEILGAAAPMDVRGEAAPGAHTHSGSPLKLDGGALPAGRLRCIDCGLVSDTKGVFK